MFFDAELPVAVGGPLFRLGLGGGGGGKSRGTAGQTADGYAGSLHVTNYRVAFENSGGDPAGSCSIPHTWILGVYSILRSQQDPARRRKVLLSIKHKPIDIACIEIECKNFRRYLFRVDQVGITPRAHAKPCLLPSWMQRVRLSARSLYLVTVDMACLLHLS